MAGFYSPTHARCLDGNEGLVHGSPSILGRHRCLPTDLWWRHDTGWQHPRIWFGYGRKISAMLDHIGIPVSNMELSRAFYDKALAVSNA